MIKILEQIEGLVSSKFETFRTILSIFKLEAKLAGLSVYPLLLNTCMIFVVLITVWLSAMFLIGYFAVLYWGTLLLAISAILFFNLILLLGLLKYLIYNLRSMSFEKTRAYLSPQESSEDGKLQKTINRRNYKAGKNITVPAKPNGEA